MSIPMITSYALPGRTEVPSSAPEWTPHPRRAALLIHDMQQYFVDFFPSAEAPIPAVIGHIAALRTAAVAAGMPVYYTAQPGGMTVEQRGLLRSFWGGGMSTDPGHRRVVSPLEPGPDDVVLTKWRYSAFVRSDLEHLLRDAGRDQLVICGVYAHLGCMLTAFDAFARDIEPFLVADAVADFTRDEHLMALDLVARRCGVVTTTDAVLAELTADASVAP
ncbi:isochorismatase family protein [Micromonospora sp. NPDC049523]|uniref:isochorismatase family protein n=1 Tax=Micromonospora sp. NPDC049523 TaxID=3155921 RepID=UPI0034141EAB